MTDPKWNETAHETHTPLCTNIDFFSTIQLRHSRRTLTSLAFDVNHFYCLCLLIYKYISGRLELHRSTTSDNLQAYRIYKQQQIFPLFQGYETSFWTLEILQLECSQSSFHTWLANETCTLIINYLHNHWSPHHLWRSVKERTSTKCLPAHKICKHAGFS